MFGIVLMEEGCMLVFLNSCYRVKKLNSNRATVHWPVSCGQISVSVSVIQSAVYDIVVLQAEASRGFLGKTQFIHAGAVCKRTRECQEAIGMI